MTCDSVHLASHFGYSCQRFQVTKLLSPQVTSRPQPLSTYLPRWVDWLHVYPSYLLTYPAGHPPPLYWHMENIQQIYVRL